MSDIVTTENQLPATPVDAAAYRELADEAGGGHDLLKFKRGKFLKGSDEEEVSHGMRYAANMAELTRGYIKFAEEGVEKVMARPGEPKIERDALGETDEDQWEKDDNGVAQDPWTQTWELPLKDAATGEELVFATSSRGGISVLGRLCNAYGARLAIGDNAVPIIELGASSYRHKRFGEVDVPTLKIVEWHKEEELIAAGYKVDDFADILERDATDGLTDDDVPF